MSKFSDAGLLEAQSNVVCDAAKGRGIEEVAEIFGKSVDWVRDRLDWYIVLNLSYYVEGSLDAVRALAPEEPDQKILNQFLAEGHRVVVAKRLAKMTEAVDKAIAQGTLRDFANEFEAAEQG